MTRIKGITGLILLLVLTGFLLSVVPSRAAWYATLLITVVHILLSAVLVVMSGPLLYQHIFKSGRWRSAGISSWFSLMMLFLIIATGCALLIQGQRGRLALLHTITATVFITIFVAHSGLSNIKRTFRRSLQLLVTSLFIALILGTLMSTRSTQTTASPEAQQFPPASFRIMGGLQDYDENVMGPKRCADCHKEIVLQWKESMHAMADTELFYARVVGEFRKEHGFEASNWCAGCHSPLRLGRGELNEKVAQVAQPNVDCIVCHSIQSTHEPMGNNNYDLLIASASGYELGRTKAISDQLLLIQPEAHRSMWNGKFMRSPEFCGACHRQTIPEFLSNGKGGPVVQDTYQEWARSKYNTEDKTVRRTCQDCHMPSGPGLDADLGKKRPSHLFLGISLDIARISGSHTAYAESKQFLKRAATVSVTTLGREGNNLELSVNVTNSGAGHNLPTGVTDLRQMWVALRVTNETGQVVYESGSLDADGFLDPSSHTFGTVLGDSSGNPVSFHHLAKVRAILSDTTIPAGETREVKYKVPVSNSKKLQVEAELRFRAVPQNFINHYMTSDLRSEVVVMSKATTTINVSP